MPKDIEMDHISIIVPKGKGADVIKLARRKGITGGTVSLAMGTASSEYLQKLTNQDLKREIVSLVTPTDMAEILLNLAAEEFGFGKPGCGIGYATNVNKVYGESINDVNSHDREESEIQIITAIIGSGKAEEVMKAARSAGASGGTLVHNPDDDPDLASLFSKDEGTDEVVLILSRKACVRGIMDAVREHAGLGPDKGIIYCQDAHFVHGLK